MRLLLFTQQLAAYRSGVGTYAHGLAKGLAARGHRVTVVVPKGEDADLDDIRMVTVPRPRLDPTPGAWVALGRSFGRVLREEAGSHDLAHFTDAREAWRLRRPALPVTGMVNDSYALDWCAPDYPRAQFEDRLPRSFYYGVLRVAECRTYRRLDALLANSRHVATALSSGYAIPEGKVAVVHYGLAEGAPVPAASLAGEPAILFAGGNFQRKGLPTLLEAAARLLPVLPELRLHVVGRDRNQPAVAERARALGLAGAVVFHGWQPNDRVRGMMAGADLFALPSLTEGFGLVYLEAMRAGTPVIATALGGAREVFVPGEEVLFVHPGDVEGLKAAILRVVSEPGTASRLRSAGKAAAERFTVDAMAEKTETVFEGVLRGWGSTP